MPYNSNTRIAQNTLALYCRMLLNMVVVFYTSRVVLSILGVEDFGIYNVVGGVVNLFTFLNTAMSSATQRFFAFEIGHKSGGDRISKVFSTSLNIHLLIAVLIFLLGETLGLYFLNTCLVIPSDRFIAANCVYQCSIVSCCIGVMALPYNAIVISYERMAVFAYISIFDVVLKLLVVYLLYITVFDKLIIYALLLLIVSLITPSVYVLYCRKNFPETKYQCVKDKTLFKEMSNFAGWNLFGNIAYMGFTQGINILLNIFFGPAANAARGVAVQIQNAIGQFSRNFQIAVNPQITKNYAVGDLSTMHSLLFRSSKLSFFLLFIISLPALLQAEKILSWWLVEVPDHTVSFFKIIICIAMIDVLANPMNISAQATGNIKKYQIIEGGTLLLIVPISYIILKLYHVPEIVFVVHLLIALLVQCIRIYLLKQMIHLSIKKYICNVVFRIFIVSFMYFITMYTVHIICPTLFDNFFICTLFSLITSGLFVMVLGLTKSEKGFVIRTLKKLHYAK